MLGQSQNQPHPCLSSTAQLFPGKSGPSSRGHTLLCGGNFQLQAGQLE